MLFLDPSLVCPHLHLPWSSNSLQVSAQRKWWPVALYSSRIFLNPLLIKLDLLILDRSTTWSVITLCWKAWGTQGWILESHCLCCNLQEFRVLYYGTYKWCFTLCLTRVCVFFKFRCMLLRTGITVPTLAPRPWRWCKPLMMLASLPMNGVKMGLTFWRSGKLTKKDLNAAHTRLIVNDTPAVKPEDSTYFKVCIDLEWLETMFI